MREIGVGPHPKPWPTDKKYDPELLKNGDTRNVIDTYRYWRVAAIKADVARQAHDFEVAIENWQHDFNIGTIVRNANAFGAKRVHIIGKRHWNKRGAMVTNLYLDVIHHASVADFVAATADKAIVAVDNVKGAKSVSNMALEKGAVLVFGGEGPGLSPEMIAAAKQLVMIDQYGSTRSVNVGVASGIIMYEWLRQHKHIDF